MEALIPLLIIVALFFVMIVLPQRRQMSARRALIESLAVGDRIITAGGIHATVRRLDDAVMDVEVADGVVLTMARQAVSSRVERERAEPSAGGGGADDAPEAGDADTDGGPR